MVLSCRHCYAPAGEMGDCSMHSRPSYMGLFVYGPAEDLQGMVAAVEREAPVPGITIWWAALRIWHAQNAFTDSNLCV